MRMFKRFLSISAATVVLMTTLLTFQVNEASAAKLIKGDLYSKDNMTITIDGQRLQMTEPILNKNGHTLLPMRVLYEALGAQITWNKQTLTASAIRDGKTIDLKINSKVAQVNNKPVSLSAPSIMYKDRTYIPLRFVTENFNGVVAYSQQDQSISISTTDQPVVTPPTTPPVLGKPYMIHLNNQSIKMQEPGIIRNNRNYIPAKYFYGYLENSTSQWINSSTLELQIEGLVFTFKDNDSNILVNQEPTSSDVAPFLVGKDMYVPVNFIVNALGGNLRFRSDTSELYIYLNQFMFNSEFLPKQEGSLKKPNLVSGAELSGNRQLFVSDNPETLTLKSVPLPTATLASHNVSTTTQSNEHRVFGWHLNHLGKKVKIGITIENKSTTDNLKISDSTGFAKKSNNSWINYDIGLPIADAVLNERLQKKNSNGLTIAPGETVLIDEFDLYPNYIVGFLNDFTIETSGSPNNDYVIRTVLSEFEAGLTEIHTDRIPINLDATHPRGVWPNSSISTTLPAYNIGAEQEGYNISNGKTDHLQTAENSLTNKDDSIGNPGHFGMTYQVNIPLVNDTNASQVIRLKATGRGGLYSGAIKVNGDIHLIPTLKPNQDYVELTDYLVKPGKDQITVELMHAGGAALPVALYIETVQ